MEVRKGTDFGERMGEMMRIGHDGKRLAYANKVSPWVQLSTGKAEAAWLRAQMAAVSQFARMTEEQAKVDDALRAVAGEGRAREHRRVHALRTLDLPPRFRRRERREDGSKCSRRMS